MQTKEFVFEGKIETKTIFKNLNQGDWFKLEESSKDIYIKCCPFEINGISGCFNCKEIESSNSYNIDNTRIVYPLKNIKVTYSL